VNEAAQHGDIIFIDEIHTVVGAGKTRAPRWMRPTCSRRSCQWRSFGNRCHHLAGISREIQPGWRYERRFTTIEVPAPTVAEAIEILKGLRAQYQDHHEVEIDDSAIVAAVRLSDRYISERQLPDKAIDLIDEAASKCARKAKRDSTACRS